MYNWLTHNHYDQIGTGGKDMAQLDFDKLTREELLHIVKDTCGEVVQRSLETTWKVQERMRAESGGSLVCRECKAIERKLTS